MAAMHTDPERVVHETIDGETLLIDLLSGTYFSLRESAAEIWHLLLARGSVELAAAELVRRYPDDAAAVEPAVRRFAEQLRDLELLRDGPGPAAAGPAPAAPPSTSAAPAAFVAPVVETFTDMQYFLMLDPIHDADADAGWPTPALDSPRQSTV